MNDFNKTLLPTHSSLKFPSLLRKSYQLALTLIVLSFFTLGCQVSYMARSAYNHLIIISQKQKISKYLERDDISEDWKEKLKATLEVRPFIQSIGLKATSNYTTFVDIKRPYVTYLLCVAPEFSLKPKTWSFPFVGSFPYKGFHKKNQAQSLANFYEAKNFDTYIRGVSAYSTLGWFEDPLLSSMLKYSKSNLIETIIHESVHATIFIKNNVSFNENLAVFIARKALAKYYRQKPNEDHKALVQSFEDEDLFLSFLKESSYKLKNFYKDKANHTIEKKQSFFEGLKKDFKQNIQPKLKRLSYSSFLKDDINNAYFASKNIYFEDLEKFEKKYQNFNDIKKFITYLKTNKKNLVKLISET